MFSYAATRFRMWTGRSLVGITSSLMETSVKDVTRKTTCLLTGGFIFAIIIL